MKFTPDQQAFLESSLTVIEVDGKLAIGSLNGDHVGDHIGKHLGTHYDNHVGEHYGKHTED